MPDWRERHVPDLGIALVELLAYVGDHLSYYQDAVATEAYLDTARRRDLGAPPRPAGRLRLHEGCNARAWVCVETDTDLELRRRGRSRSRPAGAQRRRAHRSAWTLSTSCVESGALVFEPVDLGEAASLELRPAHNPIRFHTWGDRECCLPEGATSAVLRDDGFPDEGEPPAPDGPVTSRQRSPRTATPSPRPRRQRDGRAAETGLRPRSPTRRSRRAGRALRLQPGDVLIFEEVHRARGRAIPPTPIRRSGTRSG